MEPNLILVKRMLKKRLELDYEQPKLCVADVRAERGFAYSSTLDNMYETEGNWD